MKRERDIQEKYFGNKRMINQKGDRLDIFFNSLSFPLYWGELMQYINKNDIEKSKIFEGDKLAIKENGEWLYMGYVYFDIIEMKHKLKCEQTEDEWDLDYPSQDWEQLKIIGNIHEGGGVDGIMP